MRFISLIFVLSLLLAINGQLNSSEWDDVRNELLYLVQRGVGPTCIRIVGHGSLGYNRIEKSGGLIEFLKENPEKEFGANNGTKFLLYSLLKIKTKYPAISYADLYSFCSAVAISNSCGPEIVWRPGRSDASLITNISAKLRQRIGEKMGINPINSNSAIINASSVRVTFAELGFPDKCIVSLYGIHALGRPRPENSGYANRPRTYSELKFSNSFFTTLASMKWFPGNFTYKNEKKVQFFNKNKTLAMLESDMNVAPINDTDAPKGAKIDPMLREIAKSYAANNTLFLDEFKGCFEALLELGVSSTEAPISTLAPAGSYSNLCEKLNSSIAIQTEEAGTLNEGTIEIDAASLDTVAPSSATSKFSSRFSSIGTTLILILSYLIL